MKTRLEKVREKIDEELQALERELPDERRQVLEQAAFLQQAIVGNLAENGYEVETTDPGWRFGISVTANDGEKAGLLVRVEGVLDLHKKLTGFTAKFQTCGSVYKGKLDGSWNVGKILERSLWLVQQRLAEGRAHAKFAATRDGMETALEGLDERQREALGRISVDPVTGYYHIRVRTTRLELLVKIADVMIEQREA